MHTTERYLCSQRTTARGLASVLCSHLFASHKRPSGRCYEPDNDVWLQLRQPADCGPTGSASTTHTANQPSSECPMPVRKRLPRLCRPGGTRGELNSEPTPRQVSNATAASGFERHRCARRPQTDGTRCRVVPEIRSTSGQPHLMGPHYRYVLSRVTSTVAARPLV